MSKNYHIDYKGHLRCEAVHLKSGSILETDAPTDNNGKGEKFSPTDLVATGLVTCILTVVGIHFKKKNRELSEIKCQAVKIMDSNPRRIKEIGIEFDFGQNQFSSDELKAIEHLVFNCPVSNSLSKEIKISHNISL